MLTFRYFRNSSKFKKILMPDDRSSAVYVIHVAFMYWYFCTAISITACSSNPCENGATCNVGAGDTFTCQCPSGFSGFRCEIGKSKSHFPSWKIK